MAPHPMVVHFVSTMRGDCCTETFDNIGFHVGYEPVTAGQVSANPL